MIIQWTAVPFDKLVSFLILQQFKHFLAPKMFFPFISQIQLKKSPANAGLQKAKKIWGFVNFCYKSQTEFLLILAFSDFLTDSATIYRSNVYGTSARREYWIIIEDWTRNSYLLWNWTSFNVILFCFSIFCFDLPLKKFETVFQCQFKLTAVNLIEFNEYEYVFSTSSVSGAVLSCW